MEKKVILRAEKLSRIFEDRIVLDQIDLEVYDGEFLSILGSSGCGKTTLIRLLIGIDKPNSGRVYRNDVDITDLSPSSRGMGIVFQNYALFPNMNVYDNIAYALKCRKLPKNEIKSRVDEIIKIVGLEEHINKKPNKLSGGQQQRVAIARTLVLNPDIILFDEPMAALDADLRMSLRKELKEIQKKLNMTMIYITHDQEEAFAMSDRIMVMNEGKVEQIASPKELYNNPSSKYVQSFVVNHLNEKIRSIQESV